jgi:hypothetical protein
MQATATREQRRESAGRTGRRALRALLGSSDNGRPEGTRRMEEASSAKQLSTTARREAPVRLATGLLVGVLAFAVVRQGAFYPRELRVLVVVSLLAAAAAFVSRPPERGDLAAPVAAVMALGGWAATSAWLAGAVSGALPALGLLAALVAVVVVLRRADERERETVVSAVLLIGTLVPSGGGPGWPGDTGPRRWRTRRCGELPPPSPTPTPLRPSSLPSPSSRWLASASDAASLVRSLPGCSSLASAPP